MKRSFLTGMTVGASLFAAVAGLVYFAPAKPQALQYLRVADDYDLTGVTDQVSKEGPLSARVMHACKVGKYHTDAFQNDHTGSAYVALNGLTNEQLNCVMGRARAWHLAIAFVQGIDTSEIYNLPGAPASYKHCERADLASLECTLQAARDTQVAPIQRKK